MRFFLTVQRCDRLQEIFERPQEEVKSQLQSTASLVDRWHDAYMEVGSLPRSPSPPPWHSLALSQA